MRSRPSTPGGSLLCPRLSPSCIWRLLVLASSHTKEFNLMPKETDPSMSGETPKGFVASEPPPSSAQGQIGFAPVAEPLTLDEQDDPTTPAASIATTATETLQPAAATPGLVAPLCRINLREGCYRITYQPKLSTSVFHGTMRVERGGAAATISGDLYRFLNPVISLPVSIATAATTAERPAAAGIFALPLTIPVYPRKQYFSYLKVIGIQLPPLFGTRCEFTLTAQEYVYTQPPPGQFNGTFPAAPGTRTVRLVLKNAPPPPGYTSVYFEGKLFEGATEKGTFKMGWVSTSFRRATVEIDTLTGAVPPKPVPPPHAPAP